MRQFIEMVLLVGIAFACYNYEIICGDDPFWKNVAFSTASACIFYAAFTTIPEIINLFLRARNFLKLLVEIFECCIGFDCYFEIVKERVYVGYSNGQAGRIGAVPCQKMLPYKFVDHAFLVKRGTPHQMGSDFAHISLMILKEIKLLDAPFSKRYKNDLNEIQKGLERFLMRQNGKAPRHNDDLQRVRGKVWKRTDAIIKALNRHPIQSFFFYREGLKQGLKFERKNESVRPLSLN